MELFLSYAFIFRQQFYFILPGLKIIGHGNPNNNLESPCIILIVKARSFVDAKEF
jgi:hypothetical protein